MNRANKNGFYSAAIILSVYLNPVLCIIGRDVVLTPREGLQLKGKSIYYEEDSNEVLRNLSVHPWERTLKHVTFVTLFTNAAQSAIAGNLSKLKEYSDFLESPYISRPHANPIRFGDIVTLANGRLEQVDDHNYRFIEGVCGYDCEPERVWAVWQVQKIRHRDQNQKFRYEMKFSISPLRTEAELNEPNRQQDSQEATHGGMYVRRNALKTYIQKEDDYPHSFGRIIYPEENTFAQRRQDENLMSRNFRQATPLTPIPQSTFIRGVFQPPPPGLPLPEHLNIGEYIKKYALGKATPKIELYPNMYSHINHNNYPTPTTFRPNYQLRIPKPDIYQTPLLRGQEVPQFTENSNVDNKLNPPLITHHFHHHFFMPGSGETATGGNSAENHVSSAEQLNLSHQPIRFDKDTNNQVTPSYYGNDGHHNAQMQQTDVPPAPQKISFPLASIAEHVVEITPVPPLKKPQLYPMYPLRPATQIPLLIYPMPTNELTTEKRTTSKPFIQSEPITNTFRYSEPDPLYSNHGQHASQVESPYYDNVNLSNTNNTQPLDSIEAQLPAPARNENYNNEESAETELNRKEKTDLESDQSQRAVKISTEKATDTTVKTETPQLLTTITTTTAPTTTDSIFNDSPPQHATTQPPTTTETVLSKTTSSNTQFISTSTTESPLRAASRLRHTRPTTTTTETAVLKWKPKRRNQHSNIKYNTANIVKDEDNNAKGSVLHKEILPAAKAISSTDKPISVTLSHPQRDDEIFEVLTQKSVSRSVSIKVGNNGEEIPIIIDDNIVDNEVKKY